jgi:hypothetical protein
MVDNSFVRFGRSIKEGPVGMFAAFVLIQIDRETEVDEFDFDAVLISHQNVLESQVTMYNSLGVDMTQCNE